MALKMGINGQPENQVEYVASQFRKALDATAKKRKRLYDNLTYYFGDQIPDPIKAKLADEKRIATVHNLAQRKVTGLTGALLRNDFDITYLSLDGQMNTLIQSLQDAAAADLNSGNFDWHKMSYIKYGLIQEAVMELTTNTRESPLGNLCFECCQPGSVIIDPNWRTESGRDIKEVFKYIYMLPSEIIDMFPDLEDDIKASLLDNPQGVDYDNIESNKFNQDTNTRLGSQYMVLQYTYLQNEKVSYEMDMRTGIELPKTDDIEYKKRWIDLHGINIDNIQTVTLPKPITYVCTTLPGILSKKPAQKKPHELQVGRVPFFPWSPERINGDTRGIIDIVKDLQDTLNRRKNQIDNIIDSAANGSAFVDPAIVNGDQGKMDLIQKYWTKPGMKMWTEKGALLTGKNYILPIPHTSVPPEIFNEVNQLWEEFDRILPVNAAADGRSESATESGILFSMKQQAIEVAQTTLLGGLLSVWTEMGDAYMRAAKEYYSNIERTFVGPNGKPFKINEIIPLASGDLGLKNDISSLQNLRVLVKMGKNSPNSRFTRRVNALDTMKVIPSTMPVIMTEVLGEFLDTLDVDDDAKIRYKQAIDSERVNAHALEAMQLAQYGAGQAQAEAQTQQIQNPPPPAAPLPGEAGAPGGLGALVSSIMQKPKTGLEALMKRPPA